MMPQSGGLRSQPTKVFHSSAKFGTGKGSLNSLKFNIIVASHLSQLVTSVNKKNLKATVQEINQLIAMYGDEALLFAVKALIKSIDFQDDKPQNNMHKIQLMQQFVDDMIQKPHYSTLMARSFDSVSDELVPRVAKALKFKLSQDIAYAISLSRSPNAALASAGLKHIKSGLADIVAQKEKLPEYVARDLLVIVKRRDEFEQQRGAVMKAIQKQCNEAQIFSLLPLLQEEAYNDLKKSNEELVKQVKLLVDELSHAVSLAQLMEELGHACMTSVESFNDVLKQFGTLTEKQVAEAIILLVRDAQTGESQQKSVSLPFLTEPNQLKPSPQLQYTDNKSQWNVNVFVDAVNKAVPKMNWLEVMKQLDNPRFKLFDQRGLNLLVNIYKLATGQAFPVQILFDSWANVPSQLYFVRTALSAPAEVFNFSSAGKLLPAMEGLHLSNNSATVAHNWHSLSLVEALLELSADDEYYLVVRSLFDYPIKHCPELLLLVIMHISPSHTTLKDELISILMPLFLVSNHPHFTAVLSQLWTLDKIVVIKAMVDLYNLDASHLSRVLDIAQELKELKSVLESSNFLFALDLASLASRREYLNLEKWIQEMVQLHQEPFVRSCLEFITVSRELRVQRIVTDFSQRSQATQQGKANLTPELANVFLHTLQTIVPSMPTDVQDEFKRLTDSNTEVIEQEANYYFQLLFSEQISLEDFVALLRRLQASENPRDLRLFGSLIHNLFDEYQFYHQYPDKEFQITGVLFGSLVQHQLLPVNLLSAALRCILEALKKPGTRMFAFGILALQQFQSRIADYPQFAAQVTTLLQQQQNPNPSPPAVEAAVTAQPPIVTASTGSNTTGGSAKGGNSSTGRTPNLRGNESSGPTLSTGSRGSGGSGNGGEDPNRPNRSLFGSAHANEENGDKKEKKKDEVNAQSLPIGTLLSSANDVQLPDEESMDRIHFIINNVSTSNIDAKVVDMQKVLKPVHFDYMAQYLVLRRVSIESNNQQLYCTFIDKFGDVLLVQKTLGATYAAIRSLLRSDKIRQDIAERQLLKNLGTWLGMLTIARNKPILDKYLPLKRLLLEAYEQGKLIAAIPFVSKILQTCVASKVFKPPNPWLVGLLKLLVEFYNMSNLKQQLAYEVEILFQKINVDISSIKPSELLKDKRPYTGANAVDFKIVPLPKEEPTDLSGQNVNIDDLSHSGSQVPGDIYNFTPYLQYIQINPALAVFAQNPQLKRAVIVGISRAIQEILAPVVERSSTIAVITARELVVKDFAYEPDETKMLRAAHMMVQSLAGSLASVTCKEPLRVSMMNHLRALLLQSPITEQPALAERIDAAIQTIVGENLDLGCAIIERIAAEKAILDTDEALSQAIQARRANRERGSTTYVDINVLGQRYPAALPELLKPKMVGVTANQFAVYEEFLIRSAQQTQPSPAPSTAKAPSTFSPDEAPVGVGSLNVTAEVMTPQQLQQHQILSMGTRRQAIAPTQEMFTAQDAIESFNKLMGDMVVALKQHIETHQAEYSSANPPSSPKDIITALNPTVEELIRRVASLVTGVQYYDSTNMEIATALAQRTLLKTFESQTVPKGAKPDNVLEKVYRQNLLHTYLLVLDTLASVIPRLRRDITSWVVFADDDQLKLNREVIYGLIRFRLLDATEFDLQLVKMMDKGRNPQVIEFALFLVQKCLLQERIVNQSEFVATLDELANNATKKSTEQLPIAKVLEAVKQINTDGKREEARSKFAQLMKQPLPQISAATEERIKALFDEWMSVYYQSLTQLQPNQLNDKVYAPFIQQLQQQGYYGAKDTNENELAFHKVCLREALERCHNEQADGATEGDESSQQPKLSYKAVDALAKLVVVLVKYYPDKVGFLQNILVIVGQTLHRDYHEKPLFNQRPYFRLFAGLFHEFNSLDSAFDSYTIPLLHQFSQLFHHFQPSAYPGFTFAWLELISHRMFMPKLLKEQKGWAVMQQLLVELFTFLEPHLRNVKLTPPIRLLYKGSLRVLLVLLHDFPEFLCDYHFSLCNVIPSNCIQMRNLILSAYPRTMKLPDPFTPNLKVDLLPEIKEPPRIYSNFMAVFTDMAMMRTLDQYLKTGEPASFLPELVTKLQLTSPEQINARGTKYNVPLINGLVLYVGMKALSESSVVHPYSEITAAAAMEIFRTLATQLDTEGRYWLFSAIANQLRYPNNHTHYFSRLLLFLFAETQLEIVQEQITRVLFERLITQRPHPWGLLITFIELIKNNHYNFWDRSFIRCAPEIERLFVQVNHSISRQG